MMSSSVTSDHSHNHVRFVMAAVLQLMIAQFAEQASFQSSITSSLFTSSADTFKLDLGELRKLGISSDDLVRHIRLLVEGRSGRLGECLDRASSGSLSPDQVQVSPVDNSATSTSTGAGGELQRQFLLNKTVTCNDGSKAGFVVLLTAVYRVAQKNGATISLQIF